MFNKITNLISQFFEKDNKNIIPVNFFVESDESTKIRETEVVKFTDCPICLSNDNHDLVILPCLHQLHRKCYESLVNHKKLFCPTCRMDFLKEEVYTSDSNINSCCCCKKIMTKNSVDYIKNGFCGCIFHVKCLQNKLSEIVNPSQKDKALTIYKCPFCQMEPREGLQIANWCSKNSPIHMKYQDKSFISWVCPLQPCYYNFHEGGECEYYGNPSRNGNYCSKHAHYGSRIMNRENEPESWENVESVLLYILRYYIHLDERDKFKIFQDTLFPKMIIF